MITMKPFLLVVIFVGSLLLVPTYGKWQPKKVPCYQCESQITTANDSCTDPVDPKRVPPIVECENNQQCIKFVGYENISVHDRVTFEFKSTIIKHFVVRHCLQTKDAPGAYRKYHFHNNKKALFGTLYICNTTLCNGDPGKGGSPFLFFLLFSLLLRLVN